MVSIDSYYHHGLLGVYPDGRLQVKIALKDEWTDIGNAGCEVSDATEMVSASYCNGE